MRMLANSLERRWVNTLIDELRVKLALDLEPIPTLERGMGLQSRPRRKVDFMVIGSSNAGRLTKALNEANYTVCKILNGNWRVTRESCEAMAETVKKQIKLEDPGAIMLFMLDGSTFYAKQDDSSLVLLRKPSDGIYHIEGHLVVASPDTQAAHLDTMRPIFNAIGRQPCLVISPMPRYIIEGCCKNTGHMSNRTNRHFRDDMQRQLDGFTTKSRTCCSTRTEGI
jgi:hypothetical protein